MTKITVFVWALVTLFFTVSAAEAQQKRWIGVLAVEESPLVLQTIREHGNDPARYGPALRSLLDAGRIQPAPGRYCFIPYRNGRPADRPICQYTRTGIYTMWAEARLVQPGRAMCVQMPHNWIAIAGQRTYPRNGGGLVNCYDYDEQAARRDFANTRHRAAMIVAVKARN